jgi:hypothetical protein
MNQVILGLLFSKRAGQAHDALGVDEGQVTPC